MSEPLTCTSSSEDRSACSLVADGGVMAGTGRDDQPVSRGHSDETDPGPIHWVGDAPTSLHGNGAGSFARTTRNQTQVTCRLCRTLLARGEHLTDTGATQ